MKTRIEIALKLEKLRQEIPLVMSGVELFERNGEIVWPIIDGDEYPDGGLLGTAKEFISYLEYKMADGQVCFYGFTVDPERVGTSVRDAVDKFKKHLIYPA